MSQFYFDSEFSSSGIKRANKVQKTQIQLQKRSDHGSQHQSIGFSNFGSIQQDKSNQKSYTSQIFNKPKEQCQPESKQKPQFQFSQDTSKDIAEISYLYDNNESFRFDRSMSMQIQQNQQNSRFQRLKNLLSKAKKNNLDAFYKNIEQTANQNDQGNIMFQNQNQFKQYTRNMRAQKRQQQAKFQVIMEERKAQIKANSKNLTANLFGQQAFKKKHLGQNNFLPSQYSQQNHEQQQIDFFGTNALDKIENNQQDDYLQQRKQSFYKQADQFFNLQDSSKQARGGSSKNINTKVPLDPIREEKHTILDQSLEQREFQQLIQNYANMKSNYNVLMEQLNSTSKGQFQLMDEMQRIKHDYNAQQSRQQGSGTSTEEKKQKKQQRQKVKHIKQRQLEQIKHQIHEIKATTQEKDVAYLKINEKIEQLERIVRTALQQVQQQKNQKTKFTPKVITYFDKRYQDGEGRFAQRSQGQQLQQQANLSRDSSNLYDNQAQPQYNSVRRQDGRPQQGKQTPKHNLRLPSNMHPFNGSIKREIQERSGYAQRNSIKDQLNFINEFSSPLQLDFSMDGNDANNTSSESQQPLDIPFSPPDYALQYLPLKLDQTQTKNLRSILTQKSSILYESFQFLITVRYTMQQDQTYPVIGSLRVVNKCAIDLLDLFVLVYSSQGQNVQVSPSKIYQQRLNYNANIFFQVKLDKMCIDDNGFNVQVCYKTDSITKKKVNFKALLPIIQLIRPQFCYEQNFLDSWDIFKNQIFIRPRRLNFKQIRNHEDLKLVLPFIHIAQQDPNIFSYGLIFRYPKSKTLFMLRITCYINGKASVHLRSDKNGDKKLKEELLNIINFLFII